MSETDAENKCIKHYMTCDLIYIYTIYLFSKYTQLEFLQSLNKISFFLFLAYLLMNNYFKISQELKLNCCGVFNSYYKYNQYYVS